MQEGENSPHGVLLRYYFDRKPAREITLKIFDQQNDTIITYSSVKDKKGEPVKIQKEFYQDTMVQRPGLLPARKGMNSFVWDMRYPDAKPIENGNNALISGSLAGPLAPPGKYTVRLYEDDSLLAERPVMIVPDPRLSVSDADFSKQFTLLRDISKKQSETSEGINLIRKLSKEIQAAMDNTSDSVSVNRIKTVAKPFLDSLKRVEEELTQPKAVTDYDLFNFPNRLNDKLSGLREFVEAADGAPTRQSFEVFTDLSGRIDLQLKKLHAMIETGLPEVNRVLTEEKVFRLEGK